MAEAGVDATHPSRDTSLSRRVRTLVRFCFLMAANRSTTLCFLVVAHLGSIDFKGVIMEVVLFVGGAARVLGRPSRWTS